jgi:hypothetical protein
MFEALPTRLVKDYAASHAAKSKEQEGKYRAERETPTGPTKSGVLKQG